MLAGHVLMILQEGVPVHVEPWVPVLTTCTQDPQQCVSLWVNHIAGPARRYSGPGYLWPTGGLLPGWEIAVPIAPHAPAITFLQLRHMLAEQQSKVLD